MDRTQAQWGAQDAYSAVAAAQQQQQQQQASSGAGSPQQTALGGPTVPLGVEADPVPPRDQSLPSPAPSPYPATQAEPRDDDIQPDQPTMDMEPRPASQCFPTDLQQSQPPPPPQQQPYQQYARVPPPTAPPPVPPHMLGAGSFSALHYLKQPGVMLTSLGPDANGQLDQYASNMQDLRSASLPDVIQQQQVDILVNINFYSFFLVCKDEVTSSFSGI